MQYRDGKFVEAVCPTCKEVRPLEQAVCDKCGGKVPVISGDDTTTVLREVLKITGGKS